MSYISKPINVEELPTYHPIPYFDTNFNDNIAEIELIDLFPLWFADQPVNIDVLIDDF